MGIAIDITERKQAEALVERQLKRLAALRAIDMAISASLDHPGGLAVDSAGNLFIADWLNNRVRKVDLTGMITTVAGNGDARFSGEGGPATAAGLRLCFGDIIVDAMGDLIFLDSGYERTDGLGADERVLKVVGAAAPGLLAGQPFAGR